MKLTNLLLALIVCLTSMASLAQHKHGHHHHKKKRHHKEHTHGQGKMNLAIEDNQVSFQVNFPSEVLLGFEHAPKNDKQKRVLATALEKLKANGLFAFKGASCKLVDKSPVIKSPLLGAHKHKDEHSEFDIQYDFNCDSTTGLSIIDVKMFKSFPRLEKLSVQSITSKGQNSFKLNKKNTSIKIK